MRFILLLVFLLLHSLCDAQVVTKRTATLMGCKFDFTVVGNDSLSNEINIDTVVAEVLRIENLISEWKSTSEISNVNRNAGIKPTKVSKEVFELTARAIRYSKLSEGAFDISFASIDKVWRFDGSMSELPAPELIKKSVDKIGYQNIILDSLQSTIFLKIEGMKIGFGSIGKGYAADKGKDIMVRRGVKAGIVNASGDMHVWGMQPNGRDWIIGIANPFKTDEVIKRIVLKDQAVTTSGSYQNFIMIGEKRYSHIIDPKTGYPVSELCSVTVIGPNAEIANAFSTSLMVLGKKKGLELIKKYPDYKCIMITNRGQTIYSR